jgi:hypothetical protein
MTRCGSLVFHAASENHTPLSEEMEASERAFQREYFLASNFVWSASGPFVHERSGTIRGKHLQVENSR